MLAGGMGAAALACAFAGCAAVSSFRVVPAPDAAVVPAIGGRGSGRSSSRESVGFGVLVEPCTAGGMAVGIAGGATGISKSSTGSSVKGSSTASGAADDKSVDDPGDVPGAAVAPDADELPGVAGRGGDLAAGGGDAAGAGRAGGTVGIADFEVTGLAGDALRAGVAAVAAADGAGRLAVAGVVGAADAGFTAAAGRLLESAAASEVEGRMDGSRVGGCAELAAAPVFAGVVVLCVVVAVGVCDGADGRAAADPDEGVVSDAAGAVGVGLRTGALAAEGGAAGDAGPGAAGGDIHIPESEPGGVAAACAGVVTCAGAAASPSRS